MKLGECNFEVEDDGLYRTTPISPNVSQKELIISKETFMKCFKKWVWEDYIEKYYCGRNENCPNKDTCYDYTIWHCVGCGNTMRDATEEERKSTKDYIDSISKPTGLQFDDTYEELDFVQPHKKLSVNLQLCEDCISREEVMKILHTMYAVDQLEELKIMQQKVRELPSVTSGLKTGKWIDDNKYCWICSNCNEKELSHTRFCPNCGAQMEVE